MTNMNFTLSAEQLTAIDKINSWLKQSGNKRVFQLRGAAGTGKTTLARHAAELVGGDVAFCAYTGKAAAVMRRNGCENATTLHSLIYVPKWRSDGSVRYVRNDMSALADADLIVVDEVSMIDSTLAVDLLAFRRPVLVLGDPAQLPPPAGRGFFTQLPADVELLEIHRQARGNPVIELATLVREGGCMSPGEYGEGRIFASGAMPLDELLSADQVLVGRNETRRGVNAILREALGRKGPLPEVGDRLVCTRNDHNMGIFNGATYRVAEVRLPSRGEVIDLRIVADDAPMEEPFSVTVHQTCFLAGPEELDWQAARNTQRFDYGYALTVHKAQGSQWESVCVIDEGDCFGCEAQRWRYTALTRASRKVIWQL